ncbi:hypothetical protein DY245_35760 [Streptomyces inhibens]|uniref:Uncharacterized protein n=1 Tax=Streptomyces inhibens TaxID=2293571 RepID=A0A371PUC4_STRIH|nr:hypothetical protein DY245_35760 [Streptomyces inhibens]
MSASANPTGEWISTYRGSAKQSSSWSNAHGSTRLCFNASGSRLNKGFTVKLQENSVPRQTVLWHATYWGPKHKTCSPWIHVTGQVYAAVYGKAHADVQVWVYTP